MSLKTQAKILRVLQEQKIQRVGGGRTISVNVRVIAASNKNLEAEIEEGRFREDLFYRLNVLPIEVPPLRQRIVDIPVLVETFLKEFAVQNRSKRKKITAEALNILVQYPWPGNVRELKNLVERLAIMVEDEAIDGKDIPDAYNRYIGLTPDYSDSKFLEFGNLKVAKLAFEKEYINRKLIQHHNNVTKTAEAIGVGRSFLHKKLKSFKHN
jgi:two-component system nitrogen regulation response regulator NtrX